MANPVLGGDYPLTIDTKLYTVRGETVVGIPQLGFGVYQSNGQKCIDAVTTALKAGYKHIDTAQYYGNEREVGIAVEEFLKEAHGERGSRFNTFITTKILDPTGSVDLSYEKCLDSIKALDRDSSRMQYVDLFLIHSPNSGSAGRKEMWLALERLFKEGRARLIGVSNWGIGHIEELKSFATVWPPHVNQIELHPFCQQRAIVEYCFANRIHIEAYCPLVRNTRSDHLSLTYIAASHRKTVAQVLVRYALQKKWIPLPKSETPSRIIENADVFDFHLDDFYMGLLDSLNEDDKGAIVQAVDNNLIADGV